MLAQKNLEPREVHILFRRRICTIIMLVNYSSVLYYFLVIKRQTGSAAITRSFQEAGQTWAHWRLVSS